jgi:hypothetical protein
MEMANLLLMTDTPGNVGKLRANVRPGSNQNEARAAWVPAEAHTPEASV